MFSSSLPEMTDGVSCPACEGTGYARSWMTGAGELGDRCPYCFPFIVQGYPPGQVRPEPYALPHEVKTGQPFWRRISRKRTAEHVVPLPWQTDPQEAKPFRAIEVRHVEHGAIYRPRKRTAPMPAPQGRIRHFTGAWWEALKTGPRTHQVRVAQQKAFVEAYGTIKAQQQKRKRQREEIYFWLTFFTFMLFAAAVAIGAGVFIGIYIFHLAIVHAQ